MNYELQAINERRGGSYSENKSHPKGKGKEKNMKHGQETVSFEGLLPIKIGNPLLCVVKPFCGGRGRDLAATLQ